jgi:membrane protease YdiL (CAAX protease family)
MENTPVKRVANGAADIHPSLQFLMFVGVLIGVFIIGNLIGAGLVFGIYGLKTFMAIAQMDTTVPHFIPAVWILQIVGTTLPILAAPLLFAHFLVNNTQEYIKPGFKFPMVMLLLVAGIMCASMPLIEFLSNLNQKMVLPHFLQWMRESEDSAEKLTNALLKMDNIWQMLFNLVFIGLFTAIAEEFMFRGAMQTIFEKWFKNKHVAVWITAILFSAFHMEFFGFLPRLLLGVFFGYFVAWSGSIWTGVWAHFVNNATDVIVTYLYQHKIITGNPNEQHVFNYIGYAISFVLVIILMYAYKRITAVKDQPPLE